jgi:hypothetical protein
VIPTRTPGFRPRRTNVPPVHRFELPHFILVKELIDDLEDQTDEERDLLKLTETIIHRIRRAQSRRAVNEADTSRIKDLRK